MEEESRMKSLEQLAGTLLDGGKVTPGANEKEKDGDRLQQSVKTYEQISSQLDDFYETHGETVNSDLERTKSWKKRKKKRTGRLPVRN